MEEGRIRQTIDGESFIRRFAPIEKEADGGPNAGRHVLGKSLKSAGMFALMTHPVILDLVESMIGPEQEIRWSADIRYSDPEMPTGRKEVPGFLVRSTRRRSEVANSHLDWLKLMEG